MILVIDSMELIKRMGGRNVLSVYDLLAITSTRLPSIFQEVFVFIVFFSAICTFFIVNKNGEYVAIKSLGISAMQFLLPILCSCVAMAIILITVLNPISASLLNYSELLTKKVTGKDTVNYISILGGEVWLVDDKDKLESYIINASQLKTKGDSAELVNPKFMFFDKNYAFIKIIQADNAVLDGKNWVLKHHTAYLPKEIPQTKSDPYRISNHLDIVTLQNNFKDPSCISIWHLPSFISALESTSYPTGKYYVHLYKLLIKPLIIPSVIFLAAAFMLKHIRLYRTGTLLVICLSAFVILYCIVEMLLNIQYQSKILQFLNFVFIVIALNWVSVMLLRFSELKK